MAQQTIGLGSAANDGTGDTLRDAGEKINDNFTELYAANMKPRALCATTAAITLSGEQTIDGILTSASRVLVKNQGTAAENGVYLTAAGPWSRVADMAAWDDFPNAALWVERGTINGDCGFCCIADSGGTLGSTSVTWRVFANLNTWRVSAPTPVPASGGSFGAATAAADFYRTGNLIVTQGSVTITTLAPAASSAVIKVPILGTPLRSGPVLVRASNGAVRYVEGKVVASDAVIYITDSTALASGNTYEFVAEFQSG